MWQRYAQGGMKIFSGSHHNSTKEGKRQDGSGNTNEEAIRGRGTVTPQHTSNSSFVAMGTRWLKEVYVGERMGNG